MMITVVEQSVSQRDIINIATDFRQHVDLPVLERVISELERRLQ